MGKVQELVAGLDLGLAREAFITGGKEGLARLLGISTGTVTHILARIDTQGWSEDRRVYRIRSSVGRNPFKEDTWVKYYLLGYIVGDGSITSKRGDREIYNLSISSKDKEHLLKIKDLFGAGRLYKHVQKATGSEWYKFSLKSYEVVSSLLSLGVVQSKSQIDTVYSIPPVYLPAFTLGLFDSDGCAHWSKENNTLQVSIYGRSSYLSQLKEATPFGWALSQTKPELYRLRLLGGRPSVESLYKWLYGGASLFLERKHSIWYSFLTSKHRRV